LRFFLRSGFCDSAREQEAKNKEKTEKVFPKN
jgi:hypothetical protein